MQQLCSFVAESKKFSDRFVCLRADDVRILSRYYIIGYRVMVLVGRGSVDVSVNGRDYRITQNDYLDILEGSMLQFKAISPDADLFCMITVREFLMDALQNVVPAPNNYMFRLAMNPILHISPADSITLWQHMLLLEGALANLKHYHRAEMVRLYFKSFVLEFANILLQENDWQVPVQNIAKKDLMMSDFMNLVWEHFRDNREIGFYAKELCVSAKHLSRVVKSVTGKTPHEIISREVMSLAMQLLRNEGLRIQQIADILHFSDQAAFSKFFRKYMGMSPAEYRRNF